MPLMKLESQNSSLAEGERVVGKQQVKYEPDSQDAAMLQELEELRRQRALLSPPAVPTVPGGRGSEPVAFTSAVSETTPDKALKKLRVEGQDVPATEVDTPNNSPEVEDSQDGASPIPTPKKKLDGSFQAASDLGQTGATPDHLVALQVDNSNLQCANNQLHDRVADLQEELKRVKDALQKKPTRPVEPPVEPKNLQPPVPPQAPTGSDDGLEVPGETHVGDDAARKRLERLCKRKASGMLRVPEATHKAWLLGGESRASLLETLKKVNFDQEKFIKQVTLEEESRQTVKTRVKMLWVSEDKMRELNYTANRIKAVKDFCEKNEGHTKWDKYESKVLYWVEEELEAEYEAHRSRTKRQTMEYDVETPVADAIGDFNAPITLNANEMRNGIEGMASASGGASNANKTAPAVLPQVQKNETASSVVLKYMDGITKRIGKLTELKAKYTAIPDDDKTATRSALIGKIDAIVADLDGRQNKINEIYSEGAVEGYTNEQEKSLMTLYKAAMKTAQESLNLEARARAIPVPKAGPKAGAKGKAKAKAKAKALPQPDAKPKAAPKRGGK